MDVGGENVGGVVVVVLLLLLEKVLVVVVVDDDDNNKYRCGRMPLAVTMAQWEPKPVVRWKCAREKATVD
jgi:hypothetical protein